MKPKLLPIAVATFSSLVFTCTAITHYVDANGSNPAPPYLDWTTAATNIQDAVDACVAGDLVIVTNGVYASGGRKANGFNLTNRVVINQAITVQSVNGPGVTTIQGYTPVTTNGPSAVRCVLLTNNASLIGFTIAGGATLATGDTLNEMSGGGIWCASSNTMVFNCVVISNSCLTYGGGAFQGTLLGCTLTNNSSQNFGGGAFACVLSNCMVAGNLALTNGGGAYSGVLYNCTVSGNLAFLKGGGAAQSVLHNCTVSGNSSVSNPGQDASSGGGVGNCAVFNSLITSNLSGEGGGAYFSVLADCIVSSNLALFRGGGASMSNSTNCLFFQNSATNDALGGGAALGSYVNCTFVSNSATGGGGGVYGGNAQNCIIYYNSSGAPPDQGPTSNYLAIDADYCCTTPAINGSGNITNEPAFADLANGDFHLQSNSPCINSGNNIFVSVTSDLDGNPRIVAGTVDIGTYEYQTPTSVLSYAWAQQYGLPTDGSADHLDLDGTGMNNWQKWIAGLNPTNPASVLLMLMPSTDTNTGGAVLRWKSVSNRTYYIQRATNLAMKPAFVSIRSNFAGTLTGTNGCADSAATGPGPYFYRVGVEH